MFGLEEKKRNVFKLSITMLNEEEHSMVRKHTWILRTSDRKVSLWSLKIKSMNCKGNHSPVHLQGPLALEHTPYVPVMISLSLWLSSWLLSKSARPTTTSPTMVIRMPSHWFSTSFLPRKATESRPVKMITAPRNIWKLEALVMFRAGMAKMGSGERGKNDD